jgi:hypothetical protein
MSVTKVSGIVFSIASAYAASKTMSALSNATSAVATLEASHGVAVSEYVEITSGWDLANGRIARATAVATNDVTLGNLDTSSTTLYTTGSGTGSVREITTFTDLSQISPDWGVSGGDQNFADITFVSNLIRQRLPTDRNPIEVTLPFFFDPSMSWLSAVRSVSETSTPAAIRMTFPNSTILVANAYWSLRDVPTTQDGTLRGEINLSFIGLPTVYTS